MDIKPQLTNKQMFSLNFGYLGLQLAVALQFANLTGILKFLGASDNKLSILWLASPVCGFIIPPVIGFLSDRSWFGYLGRRRFYILLGSALSFLALLIIAHSSNIINVIFSLWVLNIGVNMAQHPFRALISDKTAIKQQTKCFSILSLCACIGSAIAFITPWVLALFFNFFDNYNFEINNNNVIGIPRTIYWALIFGAIVLLITNLWSILTTTEIKLLNNKHNKILDNSISFYMPTVMRDLVKIEFLSWLGIFTFLIYYSLGLAQNIYGLPYGIDVSHNPEYSKLMQRGVELCGLHSFIYIIISCFFVFSLSKLSNIFQRKNIYAISLFLGGLGLFLTNFAENTFQLTICTVLFGVAWGSVVTIPFAILSSGVPEHKVGWYMGYFNLFVVIPQIIVSCFFGYILVYFFNNNAMAIISLGGVFMILSSIYAYKIKDPYQKTSATIRNQQSDYILNNT